MKVPLFKETSPASKNFWLRACIDTDVIGNLVDLPTIIHKIFETNSSFDVK